MIVFFGGGISRAGSADGREQVAGKAPGSEAIDVAA
jgi:hypothetical protein